jgi:peptide/nickel transport system permease protein
LIAADFHSPRRAAQRSWIDIKSTPPIALIAMGLVLGWTLIAIFGPVIVPYGPLDQSSAILMGPNSVHFFGTDELGRDVFSRIISGADLSLPYPVLAVGLAVPLGALLGGFAGYLGGWIDELIMRGTDLFFAFPQIVLAMAISAALGPSLRSSVIALVAVAWPNYTRLVRSLVVSALQSDYVLAPRLLGRSSMRTLAVDVLPNVIGPVVVFATVGIGQSMLTLAGLSFLGLGVQPPAAEWGSMISDATRYYNWWWLALFPGLAIASVVFPLNVLGDRLRDLLDPHLTSN